MRQYESCIQIIIIRIKKLKIKKNIKVKKGDGACGGEREKRERIFILFFLSFASLEDLWKSDCRFSSEQRVKFIYASRATRGHQTLSVSSNSKR